MAKPKVSKEDYQKDVGDLARKILNSVELAHIDIFDTLKGQDRINFLKHCSEVVSSEWFEKIYSNLYFPLIMKAATEAESFDEVTFNRASAAGIEMVRKFYQKYDRLYSLEFEKDKEGFDPNMPFDKVDVEQFYRK